MDRVTEPSFETAAYRPRPGLMMASALFWGLADAGYAALGAAARAGSRLGAAPRALAGSMGDLPDRACDGAIRGAVALFDHRWPLATLGSLMVSAAVISQMAPTHAEAVSLPLRAASAVQPAVARMAEVERISRPLHAGPAELHEKLQALAAAYGEPVGVAVSDVTDGWVTSVQGDARFPQQSVSKLWVAISMMDAIDHGRFNLDQTVMLTAQDRSVFNQPISYQITDNGYTTTIRDLLRRALIQSDNAANDKLMGLVGGPPAVLDVIRRKSLDGIKLAEDEKHLQAHIAGLVWTQDLSPYGAFDAARARLPRAQRAAAMQAYLDAPYDGASPVGIVSALGALKRGELISPESTEFILKTMSQARTGPRRLKGGLPGGWEIAHKTGTGQDFQGASIGINDVGLITAPDGRVYAVAVMMRRTAKPVSQRLEFMQSVTRAVVGTWSSGRGMDEALASTRAAD